MKNRAFYSEPLETIPGRLHITEDRVYVELVVKIEGKRKFQIFEREHILSISNFLHSIDYFEGNTIKYENVIEELFNIDWRVNELQNAIFHSLHSKSSKPSPSSLPKEAIEDVSYQGEESLEDEFSHYYEDNSDIFDEDITGLDDRSTSSPLLQENSEIQIEEPQSSTSTEITTDPKDEIDYGNDFADITTNSIEQENPMREGSFEEEFEPTRESDETDNSTSSPFGNIDVPEEIQSYASMFINLSDFAGCSVKEKSLLLMSLISLFEDEKRMFNRVLCNDSLIKIFESQYKTYLAQTLDNSKTRVREIFRSMKNEPFWEELDGVYTPSGIIGDIAEIDKELAKFLRQVKYRKVFKELLYHCYFVKK